MAIIFSDYHGKEDFIESESPILKGRVHYLQRGINACEREIVKVLAQILVSKVRG